MSIYFKVALFPVYNILLISLSLNFFHLLAWKQNLEKNNSIYSNKFFHNFHLFESSFNCPGLQTSGLAWRLLTGGSSWNCYLYNRKIKHGLFCLPLSDNNGCRIIRYYVYNYIIILDMFFAIYKLTIQEWYRSKIGYNLVGLYFILCTIGQVSSL